MTCRKDHEETHSDPRGGTGCQRGVSRRMGQLSIQEDDYSASNRC